ncbi:XRE family transcriptional regulator [Nocardia sp. NPDC049190]|uniref:XRE family transcriptional regulator n=1 Tax=Nocardia sp. NPDC049190 TaxID=3155650 RepID=UPI00340784A1
MDDACARRLADAVLARMAEFTPSRSRRQVYLHGGPTEPTLLAIERSEARTVKPKTLRKLNIGLDWEPGSAEDVYYNSGKPRPVAGRSGIAIGPRGVFVEGPVVTQLISVAHEIGDLAESASPAMRAASGRLDAAIQPLYARYVTQLLEANRRQGGALGPLVAVLGPFLDRVIDQGDDEEEALYRRWLAGLHLDLDKSMRQRFETRLAEGDT